MKWKINSDFTDESYRVLAEFNMSIDDCGFLIIYGKHINGYFCAIPNWGVSCEMAEPSNVGYNSEKLESSELNHHFSCCIAEAIDAYFKAKAA